LSIATWGSRSAGRLVTMIPRDELEELRCRLADPRQVCTLPGLSRNASRPAARFLVLCPWHREETPSCSIPRGADVPVRAKCCACGGAGDVLSLVAAVRGLDLDRDFPKVVEEASALAGSVPQPASERDADKRGAPAPAATLPDGRFSEMIAPLAHLGRL